MMENKRDLKIGIFAGIIGFILTFLFWYLTSGTFDLKFPAVIGIGFFGAGVLGSVLRRLQQTGDQKKVNPIGFMLLCLVLIFITYDLMSGNMSGPNWRMYFTVILPFGWIYMGYVIISSLVRKTNKVGLP
jgi:hypothetical protein